MKLTNNTVLISGGSAGIGFEIAKQLSQKGNQVIITGRNQKRLTAAVSQLTNVTAIVSDVSNENDVEKLVIELQEKFPDLNVVINNAGIAHVYDVVATTGSWRKAADEMNTNYISILRLTEKLLPQLLQKKSAAVVNVSSVVAITPSITLPTYSSSKAALHSYTEGLRLSLRNTSVKVFELMPPLVATEFSRAIGGIEKGIPASQVAAEFITAFENDQYEIHVGLTADIFELSGKSKESALFAMNEIQ